MIMVNSGEFPNLSWLPVSGAAIMHKKKIVKMGNPDDSKLPTTGLPLRG